MLKSGVAKAKKAKDHVEEGLEKVRAKPWATPLGKALQVSGKIVGAVDGFVPGAKYLGGALSFGATLLYPEPTPQELQEQLRDIKATIEGTSNEFVIQALEKAQLELEEKIANPVGEIKVEFAEVRADMKRIFSEVGESSRKMTEEMSKMRDLINQTFHIVVDTRFKDGIEKVDATYTVFLRNGFEDFQYYSFEMQTVAIQNLNPQRVKEYLGIIFQQQGLAVTQATMEYILAVMSKYLQMLVAYSIFKEDPDQVADHFERFNRDFDQMCQAFKEVTNQTFKAGQEVEALKPVAPVKPIQRESKPDLGLSDNERVKLQQFLERHGLQELLSLFLKEGVTLDDVMEMTDTEMKDLGVKKFNLRKRLLRVTEEQHTSQNAASVSEELVQTEVVGSSTDTTLSEATQKNLHLEDAHSGPPSQIELRSSGGAGEYQGSNKMGLYQLLPGGEKGDVQGPVYRQRHDGDNRHYYLYRAGEFWRVSTEVGKKGGAMKSKVVREEDQLTPPLHGWEYWGGGKWESDPTLVCSREVSDPCREVRVELHGGAKKKHPELAGSYLVKGRINRGKWVLEHADGSYRKFLRVPTISSLWSLGDTIDECDAWIESAAAGIGCPASAANKKSDRFQQKSWEYDDGEDFVEGDIRVTCITHS